MIITVLLLALAAGCGGASGQSGSGRLKVAATIVPVADFCRNVGGDLVEVKTLIPAQAGCGHTFEPTPSDTRFIADSRVFVTNGLGLETWATDVLSKVGNSREVFVVASDAIPRDLLRPTQEKGGPGASVNDPHVWLDPTLAVYEVQAIRDGFIKADPAHAADYTRNADAYFVKLKALDSQIASALSGIKRKEFLATHPTWTYLAARYGLVQAGAVEELPGKEPSISQMTELLDKVRERGIKVVLAEPQISPRAVEVLAQDAGDDVRVVTVDPVGNPGDPEVATYIRLMRHDASVLERAMK